MRTRTSERKRKKNERILINWSAHTFYWYKMSHGMCNMVTAMDAKVVAIFLSMFDCPHTLCEHLYYRLYSTTPFIQQHFLRSYFVLLISFRSFNLFLLLFFRCFLLSTIYFFFVEYVADITCSLLLDLCHVGSYWEYKMTKKMKYQMENCFYLKMFTFGL